MDEAGALLEGLGDVEKWNQDSPSICSPKIWVWVPVSDLGLWPGGSAGAPDMS